MKFECSQKLTYCPVGYLYNVAMQWKKISTSVYFAFSSFLFLFYFCKYTLPQSQLGLILKYTLNEENDLSYISQIVLQCALRIREKFWACVCSQVSANETAFQKCVNRSFKNIHMT